MVHRPRRRKIYVAGAGVVLLIALALLWDWNWLRPLVAHQASSALGRPVTLQHFDVRLGWHPWLIADGITIANPAEFPDDKPFGTIKRLALRLDPWTGLNGRVSLLAIEMDQPVAELRPGPSGKSNALFDGLRRKDVARPGGEPPAIAIGSLTIRDGDLHIVAPEFKSDFRLKVRTEPRAGGGEPELKIDIDGRYANAPISGRFIGGSVLSLRTPAAPYPVDLRVRNGDTKISLQGTLLDPIALAGAELKLEFRGNNIADLYPLTGVPLPPSPPYEIAGDLDYDRASGAIRFRHVTGHYGQSDIAGDVSVVPAYGTQRRKVTIVAHSDQVVWHDLSGFVGATPGVADAPNDSDVQKAARKKQANTGKLLPDTPIALPRIRAADLDVQYRVAKIASDKMPVDTLSAHLVLEDGLLSVKPLKLGVGKGSVVADIVLDGRKSPIHTVAELDFRQLDFSKVVDKLTMFRGTGTIGGHATLDAHGNSLAAMLASGDGGLKLFMSGGDISALLVNLAGLDLGNSLISALGLPSRARVRCMIMDLGLDDGQVKTHTMLFDTTEANLLGSGTIDLDRERIDYQIHTQPKRMNIGSLGAPIKITGSLRAPRIMPDPEALAVRGGIAVALGVLLTPLAALVPTIQLGLGEDNDCVAMIHDLQTTARSPDRAKH